MKTIENGSAEVAGGSNKPPHVPKLRQEATAYLTREKGDIQAYMDSLEAYSYKQSLKLEWPF